MLIDFAAAVAAGFTEDRLFELVICGAVGESSRLYQAGMAALAEASFDNPVCSPLMLLHLKGHKSGNT